MVGQQAAKHLPIHISAPILMRVHLPYIYISIYGWNILGQQESKRSAFRIRTGNINLRTVYAQSL